jgi:hypothetical protein
MHVAGWADGALAVMSTRKLVAVGAFNAEHMAKIMSQGQRRRETDMRVLWNFFLSRKSYLQVVTTA